MTSYQWIGAVICSGVVGWWVEHRRWVKPGKRHAIYVRSRELAQDKVFITGLEALVDKAWRSRISNTGQSQDTKPE